MNDDQLLSLYIDGRLPEEEAAAFELRLAGEESLRARLEEHRVLQGLSRGLGTTRADFTAADVRARARPPQRAFLRWGVAAAAVLLLALTHGSAYLLGANRGVQAAEDANALRETEAILQRALQLDADAPHDRLRTQLVGLRDDLAPLPARLHEDATAYTPQQRRRLVRLSRAVQRMEIAFEQFEDPGFLGIALAGIARDSLQGEATMGLIPVNATSYSNLAPVGGGRFRMVIVTSVDGAPRMLADEGTIDELKSRNPGVEFVEEGR